MAFTPKTWANDAAGATPITAAELNRIEAGVEASVQVDTAQTITGKKTYTQGPEIRDVSTNGYVSMNPGTASRSGYNAFYSPTGTRQGYIGNSPTDVFDAGTLEYVAGAHVFSGTLSEGANRVYSAANPPPGGSGGSNFPLFAILSADYSSSVVSAAGVAGLAITLAANTKYMIRVNGLYQTAVTTTGITVGLSGTAQTGLTAIKLGVGLQTTTTAVTRFQITTTTGTVAILASQGPMPGTFEMFGVFTTGATGGTFMPSFATEVAASVATLLAGTYIEARAI